MMALPWPKLAERGSRARQPPARPLALGAVIARDGSAQAEHVRGGVGRLHSRRRAGATAGAPVILAAHAGWQGERPAKKRGMRGVAHPIIRVVRIISRLARELLLCVNICKHIITSRKVGSLEQGAARMRDERSEVGGQIDDRNMRDRKMIGGAIRGWCIKHPNNGFLLPPYSRSTRVLLSSYWPPTAVLLESCFAETAKNEGNARCSTREEKNSVPNAKISTSGGDVSRKLDVG